MLRVTEAQDYDLVGTLLPSPEGESLRPRLQPALFNIQPAPSFVVPNQIPAR
jgi:hypothetical protein